MLDALKVVLDRVAAVEDARQQHIRAVTDEATRVLGELTAALLPALVPENLDVAANAVGLPALASATVMGALQAERGRLLGALREIESAGGVAADTRRLDELEREIADVAAWRESMKNAVDRRTQDPEFRQLLEDAEGGSWWMFSFYRRVARADALVKRHGEALGLQDWSALMAHHARQLETLRTLDDQRAEATRQRALVRSRLQRDKELREALGTVEAHHLRHAQAALGHGLATLPHLHALRVLPAWAHAAVTRLHGLRAKAHYLEQMGPLLVGRIHADADELHRRLARLQDAGSGDVVYSRQDRATGLQQRLEHAAGMMDHLVAWNAYARFDPAWPLWWDWFFEGNEPGTFIEEVAVFRAEHRGTTFQQFLRRPPARVDLRADPNHRRDRADVAAPVGTLLGRADDDDDDGETAG